MILYGIVGIATIVAALLTDGAAFVAEVVILPASAGFLLEDVVGCVATCSKPQLAPQPLRTGKVGLRLINNHYMTVIRGGGGPDDTSSPFYTGAAGIGDRETVEFLSQLDGTFAIQTAGGNWVTGPTAVAGPIQNSIIHSAATRR